MKPEPFENRVINLVPATARWEVVVLHTEKDQATKKTSHQETKVLPVILWALVERTYSDGRTSTCIEPAFYDGLSVLNESEYRRLNSDLDPLPDDPRITIGVDLRAVS
ncbi:hypothetical protein ACWD4T_03505 [Streptomyces umbrinus]